MIVTCVQRSSYVYVYDESNRQLFYQFGELAGYTSNSVSIKKDDYIYTFDEKGHKISSHYSK